ncbi:multidrug efflux SMR transporter [Virgibacillus necropolis]|uniref:DMT family transporter n=1 Tax=Virgibacillus necropolis TaxID=163877 RepID=UPI00384C74A7
MSWILLVIAGGLEVFWASYLKYADSLLEWGLVAVFIVISFGLLTLTFRTISVAVAYTVFVGIGTIGIYLVGILTGEPFSIKQLFFFLLLVIGVLGMKVTTKEGEN